MLSNNVKLALSLKLDGVYLPSFNKQLKHLNYSFANNFILIGSAHNLKEIRLKELQKVSSIVLSSIFKKNKNFLGLYRFQLLKKLSNSSHEVITAVCFLTKEKIEIIHEVSTVTFGQVSENEINDYIKTGSPFDKAGSYGIQDPFGIRNIVSINGSYTNIIGLPVAQVFKKIKEIIIEN